MRYLLSVFTITLASLLAACGGGGGSPGGAGSSSVPGGSSSSTASPTLVVTIFNSSNAKVNTIGVGSGFAASATVRDAAGTAVANRLVTFSLNGASIATLSPESALTDAAGVAKVSIAPSSVSALGAATVAATAVVGTATVQGQADFAVSASNLSLSALTVGSSNLPSGGNTSVNVTALIGGAASTGVPININFTVSCGRINGVGGSVSLATDGRGVASAVYTAVSADGLLCSGPVTVSAASAGASSSSTTITVTAPIANAITFASAAPAQIFVAGSGALEQSLVKFKAFAGSTPLSNVAVRFTLLVNPGGVGLNTSGSSAEVAATTNAQGEASVSVFSGSIPGPVRVRATLVSDAAVFAETQNLSVSSGPPSQRFMSLSVETFNIEGWNIDGTATKLTVRLADRQGNPVEDGTVVNFTAEGGQVASSCPTLKGANGISACSVDFISQNPRPAGGRASVLAFTSGTKDYADVNGNNRYDAGIDTLFDIGDAYRDDGENAVFDAGEFVVPRGGVQACPGTGGSFPGRANTCDSTLATTVRQQTIVMFSSSTPSVVTTTYVTSLVVPPVGTPPPPSGGQPLPITQFDAVEFLVGSIDNLLLPMPSGTTVTADTAGSGTCKVDKVFGSPITHVGPGTNPSRDLRTPVQVYLKDCRANNVVLVNVKAPSGLTTTFSYRLPSP